MKKSFWKIGTVIMVMSMLVSMGITSASAKQVVVPEVEIVFYDASGAVITPFASDVISSWSPLLSKTAYGADITFTGRTTGSITVRLQNSSGINITSFTRSFTNVNSIRETTSRTTASGTYKIQIAVTVSGTTTTRTSSNMNI